MQELAEWAPSSANSLIFNRYTNSWCSSGDVQSVISQELSYTAEHCAGGPGSSFWLKILQSKFEHKPRNKGIPANKVGGTCSIPRIVSQVIFKAAETLFFFIVVFFLASGSNNICTHLGKLPKTADGFVGHEGLRSCQEESKMHDWGWSDNSLLLVAAQCHTSKAAGQWTGLHQRLPGLSACMVRWGGSAVSSAGISRASCSCLLA